MHVAGSFNTARAAWPHMVEQGYGRIVMTTSSGMFGLPDNTSYATAKAAVIGLTRSLTRPGPPHGIKVNLIAPAALTRMAGRGEGTPEMSPDLVAPMVAFLAHEACPVSGEIYSAGFGRFARLFIASTEGSCSTAAAPTVEDVAAHWATINDETDYYVPTDLMAWSARFMTHLAPARWTSSSGSRTRPGGALPRFAQREIAAGAPRRGRRARCPTDLLREMGGLGLLGMLVPEEWGGIGMSTTGFVAAMEQIGRADQSVAAAWQAHVTIGSLPLYLFGSDAQRERWLRPLAEGRALGAFGLTEPDAGSDAHGIRTRAERRDGGWLINGRKTSISNAGTDMSFGVTLLARTEYADYATLVVEKDTPGFTMGPKMRGIGWGASTPVRCSSTTSGCPPTTWWATRTWGSASSCARWRSGRISIAALSLSLTQAVLDLATAYARAGAVRAAHLEVPGGAVQAGRHRHRAGGGPLAHLPGCLPARHRSAVPEGGGDGQAQGQPRRHVGGIRGRPDPRRPRYMLETPVARFYCDSKVLEIGEGTNEIQHLVIARALGC